MQFLKGKKWGINLQSVHCPQCNKQAPRYGLQRICANFFGVGGPALNVDARWINGENPLLKNIRVSITSVLSTRVV